MEKSEKQSQNDEAARFRESAQTHRDALKNFWISFLLTGVTVLAVVAIAVSIGFGWFIANDKTQGQTSTLSAAGSADFALATVGTREQGSYDGVFGLTQAGSRETIGGVDYYISSGDSSFRVSSKQNFNNYFANANLRPGNRGTFDIYVLCRADGRNVTFSPIFSAVGSNTSDDAYTAALGYLYGHILVFAHMDALGMYSDNIDLRQDITIDLAAGTAVQGERTFAWGEETAAENGTTVYRLSFYWVWPEKFGNFIYTGNSYNKNLFATKGADYSRFISRMASPETYRLYFATDAEAPSEESLKNPTTAAYDTFCAWYDQADEAIGTYISYVALGFELR